MNGKAMKNICISLLVLLAFSLLISDLSFLKADDIRVFSLFSNDIVLTSSAVIFTDGSLFLLSQNGGIEVVSSITANSLMESMPVLLVDESLISYFSIYGVSDLLAYISSLIVFLENEYGKLFRFSYFGGVDGRLGELYIAIPSKNTVINIRSSVDQAEIRNIIDKVFSTGDELTILEKNEYIYEEGSLYFLQGGV